MLEITPTLFLHEWEMTEQFIRASGPGGQHVNKTSTAVVLRFEALRSPSLTDVAKTRLRKLAGQRWTKDGAIVIQVDSTRSQTRNRELARARLQALIQKALARPKRRIPTKPTKASVERRIEGKKQRAVTKSNRRSPLSEF